MVWHARLDMDYRLESQRSVGRFQHEGPLRVLQTLYPEGDAICHNVIVHPPGGLVGGDTLEMHAHVHTGAHALVTTPGATRFYKSNGHSARQVAHLQVDAGARLEWLPLEAIAYNQCDAENLCIAQVAPGGELLGWDVTALGLPHASQPFTQGQFTQHLQVPGVWLERGRIAADDSLLMNSPLGLAGQRCLASLFFVAGEPITRERRELALELAQQCLAGHALAASAGVTSPHPQVLVLRCLAPVVEPAMELLQQTWGLWCQHLWQLPGQRPRIWST